MVNQLGRLFFYSGLLVFLLVGCGVKKPPLPAYGIPQDYGQEKSPNALSPTSFPSPSK